MTITVIKPGAFSQLQDLGRYGYQRFGVVVGGAMDEWSHRLANALVGNDEIDISGTAKVYASSEHGRRHFCPDCGTGLFYTNEAIFPGQIDVQTATLDDPDAIPAQAQIQTAERIGWMEKLNDLPAFERYPPFE